MKVRSIPEGKWKKMRAIIKNTRVRGSFMHRFENFRRDVEDKLKELGFTPEEIMAGWNRHFEVMAAFERGRSFEIKSLAKKERALFR